LEAILIFIAEFEIENKGMSAKKFIRYVRQELRNSKQTTNGFAIDQVRLYAIAKNSISF
jgi:hypothetical protein